MHIFTQHLWGKARLLQIFSSALVKKVCTAWSRRDGHTACTDFGPSFVELIAHFSPLARIGSSQGQAR